MGNGSSKRLALLSSTSVSWDLTFRHNLNVGEFLNFINLLSCLNNFPDVEQVRTQKLGRDYRREEKLGFKRVEIE